MKSKHLILVIICILTLILAACTAEVSLTRIVPVQESLVTTYQIGAPFDDTSSLLALHYSDGTTKEIPLSADMVSGFNTQSIGKFTATVRYQGLSATFSYSVSATQTVKSATLHGLPEKIAYGEQLPVANAYVLVMFSDGSDQSIPLSLSMLDGFTSTQLGEHSCQVRCESRWGEVTCTYLYTVIPAAKIVEASYLGDEPITIVVGTSVDEFAAVLNQFGFSATYEDGTVQSLSVRTEHIHGFSAGSGGEKSCTVRLEDQFELTIHYRVQEERREQAVSFLYDETLPAYVTITVNGLAVAPVFQRKGYELIDWRQLVDGVTADVAFDFDTVITQPITLIANWRRIEYTATLKNFGEVTEVLYYNVENGLNITPPAPRPGYTFLHYILDGVPTNSIPKGTIGNIELIGQWDPITYTLSYDLADSATTPAENHKGNPTEFTIDDVIVLQAPTRAGYDFVGWSLNGNIVTEVSQMSENLRLVAVWRPATLFVTFVHNGQECMDKQSFTVLDSNSIISEPSIEGYAFLGWYYDRELTNECAKEGARYIVRAGTAQSFTLYAKAVRAYHVDLLCDGERMRLEFTENDTVVDLSQYSQRFGCDLVAWRLLDGDFEITPDADGSVQIPAESLVPYAGRTFEAVWAGRTYTITYIHNYEDYDGKSIVTTQTYNTIEATQLTLPERPGYAFGGWHDNETLAGNFVAEIAPLSRDTDLTFWARWSVVTYHIDLHYQLDETLISQKADIPETYNVLSEEIVLARPVSPYYTFGGWFSDSNYTNRQNDLQPGSTGDLSLYALWTPITYQISLYQVGGEAFVGIYPQDLTYTYESQTQVLATPTRRGYSFGGWFADKEGTQPITQFEPKVHCDTPISIYAKWNLETYSISYVVDGGKHANTATAYDVNSEVVFEDAVRNGYAFLGWYASNNPADPMKITSTQGLAENLKLYARYEKLTYSITYYPGTEDISCETLPQTYSIGCAESSTTTAFNTNLVNPIKTARPGYEFMGWYLEPMFTTKVTQLGGTSSTALPCQDVSLYAKWQTITYSITYKYRKTDGATWSTKSVDTAYRSFTVEQCQTADGFALAPFTEKGYAFNGWCLDATLSKAYFTFNANDLEEILPTLSGKTITLYTQLEQLTFSVSYVLPDGALPPEGNPDTVVYSTTAVMLASPTLENHKWIGWYDNQDYQGTPITKLVGIEKDTTLYGRFEPIRNISYQLDGATLSSPVGTFTADVDTKLPTPTGLPSGARFWSWWYVEGGYAVGTTLPAGIGEDVTLRIMYYDSSTTGFSFSFDGALSQAAITAGTATTLVIPTYVGSQTNPIPVTQIDTAAFDGSNVSKISFAPSGKTSSITKIGAYAFRGTRITSLELPTAATVGTGAFANCTLLTKVILHQNNLTGQAAVFNGCSSLVEINAADSTLGYGALTGVHALSTLHVDGTQPIYLLFGTSAHSGLYAAGSRYVPTSLVHIYCSGTAPSTDLLKYLSGITDVYWTAEQMVTLTAATVSNWQTQGWFDTLTFHVPSNLLETYQATYPGNYSAIA